MDPRDPKPLAFDDVAIDFAGHRLLRAGVEQPLEPKAFGVLALLAGAPGKVFARDEILDAVWGHRHVTPGVLNRVMTLLRHALGEDAQGARYLHTVHGVGYRFDLPEAAREPSTAALPDIASNAQPRTSIPPPQRRASDRTSTLARVALWSLPLLAALAIAAWTWWPHAAPAPVVAAAPVVPAMERSVAVLPLVNASNDPNQQFFSDGLSDNLIDALSKFEELKVIGRNSAFQFRDSKDDSAAIGRKLGATYLLSGSVQRAGDVVRINTSLTKAADGSTQWAEHYDRPYKDLFALQDEIASAVARALQAKLLPENAESKQDDRPPSGNLDAYNAYLQGLKYWHDENFRKAAEYMTQAVQLDPGYAMAWALLSGSWSTVATFWNEPPAVAEEHMRIARDAADKALRLASALGAAHAARCYLDVYGFDQRAALAECRRAVQLAPGDGTVLNGSGYVFAQVGKLGEAIQSRKRLLSIEPLYLINYQQYARLLMLAGRLDEAEKYLRTAESLPQANPYWHSSAVFFRMVIALVRGDADAAMNIAEQTPSKYRGMNEALAAQISSDRAAADRTLAALLDDKAFVKDHPYEIAQVYALRGDAGHAVEWLQRASTHDLVFLPLDPLILQLRDDPRFIAFCKQNKVLPPGENEALSIDQIRAKLATRG
ncbi:winged helix-turn-helix domain-containing protein [Pseudoluteimonas lycopersici]|nr:winged helix-turn-helix domain-containing protein [Lysobacter lycopersici]